MLTVETKTQFTAQLRIRLISQLINSIAGLLQNIAKLYIGITTSMSLELSTCVLSILLAQVVNFAQFLNITFLLVLLAAVGATTVFVTAKLL